jgi:hypothetical protein
MLHYVYLLTDKSLTKYYIGVRSCDCSIAKDNYWGSSKHLGPKTTRKDRFYKTILGVYTTREEAVAEEIRLHNYYDVAKSDKFYNRAKQTSIGWDTTGMTGEKSASYGVKRSEEFKAKISAANSGKARPEDVKRRISNSLKGCQFRLGSKRSKETNDLITKAQHKAVLCVELGVVYKSFKDAAKAVGAKDSSSIVKCAKGGRGYTSAYGYTWEYYKGDINE